VTLPSARLAGKVFVALQGVVIAFQLALALGAPWGEAAMGGTYPGAYPAEMRIAALVQAAILAGAAYIVALHAGLMRRWRPVARWPIWMIVVLLAPGVVLNLITPSALERLIWAPVATVLFLAGLRVALSRPG
jgi:hypothetical protein